MRDLFEQLRMHLWMVLHHRWAALIGALVFCAMGWGWLEITKDQFQVDAKVYLDTKAALRPLFSDASGREQAWNPQQSAMLIKRTLLTRENIESIINSTGLKEKVKSADDLDKVIKWLATDIKVERMMLAIDEEASYGQGSTDIYSISFRSEKPELSKNVVETVLNLFVERLTNLTRTGAQEAAVFLDREINSYSAKLEEAEDRLKQFKQAHPDVLLDGDGENFSSRVEELERELETAQVALREAEYRAQALRGQVQTMSMTSRTTTIGGESSLDGRIEAAETRLNELLTNYTEQHPDVIGARRALEDLREQKKNGRGRTAGTVVTGSGAEVAGARMLLADAEGRAAAMREQIVVYERKLAELKPMADTLPKIEAELAKLNRDYDVVKETYAQLVQRRETIKLSEGVQTVAGDSLFKVIEPPRVPRLPVAPPRFLLTTAIFVASVILGLVLAWVRAQGKPTFYTRSQLAALGGVPVIGSVTMDWSFVEVAKRRLGLTVFSLASLVLLAAYLAMLMHYGYDFKLQMKTIATSLGMIKT